LSDYQQRLCHLTDGLKRAGVKLTHQRLEICREVAAANTHPDADAIYLGVRERVPTISVDTVYRTLWLLRDLGLIGTLTTCGPSVRFDGDSTPHHHFVCTSCGEVYDFYSEEFNQLRVPHAVRAHGIVQKTQVEMRGTCLRCAQAAQEKTATTAKRRRT
jgi:Fur family peroxide stress response transcriptional regulator